MAGSVLAPSAWPAAPPPLTTGVGPLAAGGADGLPGRVPESQLALEHVGGAVGVGAGVEQVGGVGGEGDELAVGAQDRFRTGAVGEAGAVAGHAHPGRWPRRAIE